MAKENKAEKKAAKKAAKAEKRANRNPEIVKTVISSVTAVACVIAVVVTSLSITDKVCETNKTLASNASTSGNTASEDSFNEDFGTNDTSADVATDDTTATEDTAAGEDATAADDTTADTSSSSGSTSTATTTSGAPVGTDVAKIVAYYNSVANATKAYKGKMVIKARQGSTTKITETSFPDAAMSIANGMLPNDFPTDGSYNKNYTVTNGVATDGRSIKNILPIDDSAKMSTLAASGVKSAKCAKSGNGYKIEIKLKPESTNSFDIQPTNHKACMDCLNMTSKDLEPFTCESCKINYTGGTIIAVVNDKGLLTEFKVNNPLHITGTLKWTVVKGDATIDASWRQEVVIAY